jgi:pimeloyl-ACP methyl ester carboxylesterase
VDHRSWDAVVPGLVSAGYRVIRYDQRGFGASVTLDVEFDERADLLAVLDSYDVARAPILGNSRGGHIGFDTAITAPERIAAVISLGSGPGGFDGDGLTPTEEVLFVEGGRLESEMPRDAGAIAELLVRIWVDGPGQSPTRVDPAVRETVRATVLTLYAPGHIAGKRIPLSPPANERLGELRCPGLAVLGALDLQYLVAAAHRLEEAAPNARAVVWPDVAHMIGMEQPARLVALVTEFLGPLEF